MRLIGITLILFLVGCSAPSSTAEYKLSTIAISTSTPIALPSAIAPNSGVTITLPAAGTPKALPTMELHIKVYDDVTGQPLTAQVAWLVSKSLRAVEAGDLQWVGEGVDLLLPGEVSGWLVINAPGYEEWVLQVEYQIRTSRDMEMPVRMRRAGSSL